MSNLINFNELKHKLSQLVLLLEEQNVLIKENKDISLSPVENLLLEIGQFPIEALSESQQKEIQQNIITVHNLCFKNIIISQELMNHQHNRLSFFAKLNSNNAYDSSQIQPTIGHLFDQKT